jgi:diaminopimelate epimerase
MAIRFTKMHGIGNDFVMLDGISQHLQLKPRDIRRLADRHLGIGCDQVLIVEPPGRPDVDFRYRIFNPDGSEAEQCGNGARCFARFVRHRRLTSKRLITIETNAGITRLRVLDRERVEVDMGRPVLEPAEIPFLRPGRAPAYELTVDGRSLTIGAVSMGNPHAVLRVDDVDSCDLARLGPAIESHGDFPKRTNAGFMQVLARDAIRLRVYERGAGETLACGSGACAAVVWGRLQGWLDARVTVNLPGGKLSLQWEGDDAPVFMAGPTAIVFEGTIRL